MTILIVNPSMRNILKICFLQISSLLILTPLYHAAAFNVIKSVPGYPDNLPFYLETGYVGVGDNEGVQLFYYFIKSERNPQTDPLILWLTGGPGCSALSGLVLEIGPLIFNTSAFNWHSKAPTFQLNPFSWTKVASIIFLDSPVGTGFSYATDPEHYYTDDITSSEHIYQFLRKWLMDHVGFQNNPLYICGDSYSGMIVPIVVKEISKGNKVHVQPIMNLQSTRISCNGTFEDVDAENIRCSRNLKAISYNLDPVFAAHVLKPKCISDRTWCQDSIYRLFYYWANDIQVRTALDIQKGTKSHWTRCNRTLAYAHNLTSVVDYHQNLTMESIHALIYRISKTRGFRCPINELRSILVGAYRQSPMTNQARGSRCPVSELRYRLVGACRQRPTINQARGFRCPVSELRFRLVGACRQRPKISQALGSRYLVNELRSRLVGAYSGDQDMVVSYLGTLEWIKMLNITIAEDWRPWFANGQVAGYITKYSNDNYHLTYATVKGAGHTAPEYKRAECFTMLTKWFAMHPR
ncbi:serine carboxypeptidase-like 13 isoform X3 [Beta vulgaris subsp. vulgaris]|uniref:serine carboxypeptidase-like 13 isoform X3 n=1 Tax=Beta vulgaris subsp. vulgaris TaxID=3555 RepID=UPI0020372F9E|nr:serine carboxypeptidase-like 13 isoform X3 [Beta vulgaris subsp. vulgaris]